VLIEIEAGGICIQCITTTANLRGPVLPVIPQCTDDLGGRDVVGIVRNQSEQKRAVLTKIVDHELAYQTTVVSGPTRSRPRQTTAQHQVIADELQPVLKQHSAQQPYDEADNASKCYGDHPEPEEHVNLLVVQVDGQDALDSVRLHVAEVLTTDLEVAESDSWKRDVAVFGPVRVRDEMTEHVDAERRVARRQDSVQHEQLTEHVDDVAQLGEEEQHHQIVAQPVRTSYTVHNFSSPYNGSKKYI